MPSDHSAESHLLQLASVSVCTYNWEQFDRKDWPSADTMEEWDILLETFLRVSVAN